MQWRRQKRGAASAEDRTRSLTEGPILASLFRLAVPVVFANLMQTAYQLIDTFWVGRLGQEAVAAVSASFPAILFLISLGGGLGVSGSAFVAQYAGARRQDMVNHSAAQTLLMVLSVGAVFSVIGFFVAGPLMNLMGVAPDVFTDSVKYLQISFAGMIFLFCYFTFQAILRGVGEVKFPLYVVTLTVFLNLGLDPLFIFGWGPIAGAGVAGAAYATITTQGIAAVIGMSVLFTNRFGIHLGPASFKPDLPFIKRALKVALPASVEQTTRSLGMMIMTFLVAGFGTLILASYGIGVRILSFVLIPALGLSMATTALVGQNIGAGNLHRAERVAYLSAGIAFVLLTAVGALFFIFASTLVTFFVPNEPQVVVEGAHYIRVMALTFGFLGLQMALFGAFRGAGATMTTMILAITTIWVVQFPVAYVLSYHTDLGAQGIWWAYPTANVLMAGVTVILFMRGGWKRRNLTQEEQFEEKVGEEIVIEEGVQ